MSKNPPEYKNPPYEQMEYIQSSFLTYEQFKNLWRLRYELYNPPLPQLEDRHALIKWVIEGIIETLLNENETEK